MTSNQNRFDDDDDAVAGVVGEVLGVAVMLLLAGALAFSIEVTPPDDKFTALVSTWLDCGLGGWNTGDERIVMRHMGGEAIDRNNTRIVLELNDVVMEYPSETYGAGLNPDLNGDGLPESLDDVLANLEAEMAAPLNTTGLAGDFVNDKKLTLGIGEYWSATMTIAATDQVHFEVRSVVDVVGARDIVHQDGIISAQKCNVL